MRRILETLAVCIAFVAAFLLVREFKVLWFTSTSIREASDAASATADKEIKVAQDKAALNKTATEILVEKGRSDITSTFGAAKTDKEKFIAASNFFFGAYFLNTRARAEYCSARGVKIENFVAAYEKTNHDLFVSAEKYQIEDLRDHGYTYDIDQLYKMMSPTLDKYVAQDMKDIASTLKLSETEVCNSFQQKAAEWAEAVDYKKRVPDGAQLLLMK